MVEIIITDHKAIDWVQKDNFYFRGWFFHENNYYEKIDTPELFTGLYFNLK